MRPFKCVTTDCAGTAAPTSKVRETYWGFLRIWLCSLCEREYHVNAFTPTIQYDEARVR